LRALGAIVTVYDPMGGGNALVAYPELVYADSAVAAAEDADVLVVTAAWPEFAQADASEVARRGGRRAAVDACQGIDILTWREAGWQVASLTGVPSVETQSAVPGPGRGRTR
jgi:UDPglucose 6-dehydrogenase